MKEKIVLITGATSGIGKAAALLFAQAGAQVIAVGRDVERLNEVKAAADAKISVFSVDVTAPDEIDELIRKIDSDFGRLDVLINAAGIIANGSVENTTLADWDTMLDVNLRAVFYLMHKAVPLLKESKGNVVNVSSVTGIRAFPNVLAYCVSKAAVDQLTRCTALELAPFGVRVNAVNPGVVQTNLHKRSGMDEDKYAGFLEHSKTTHPLGRVGQPIEVADLIFFLASEKAEWITGATYEIDGGRAQTCAR